MMAKTMHLLRRVRGFPADAQDFMNRVEGGDVLNYEMLQLQKKMLLSLVPLLFILQ